ncbi:MAG: FISUMP domain-containing protein, partial [Bacteroidota bacterium]
MARILFLMMLPFVCFSQITPREDIPVNNILKEKENLNTKRKAFYNLDEIKVRWKKAALENCPGVPCVVAPSFTCGTSTVSDVDGNSYETVAIGNQCWMKSNLRVMNYNNNDPIPDSTNSTWGTAIIGARTGYDVSVVPLNDYVGTFGYLYNWYAVNDARKI